MGIEQCQVIELPKVADPRGNLSFIESGKHVPFEIKRVYYLYDVPGGETRAGHAMKTEQFIIAASGSFDLILDDGKSARPSVEPFLEGRLHPHDDVARTRQLFLCRVCLALASAHYDPNDYIRTIRTFCHVVAHKATMKVLFNDVKSVNDTSRQSWTARFSAWCNRAGSSLDEKLRLRSGVCRLLRCETLHRCGIGDRRPCSLPCCLRNRPGRRSHYGFIHCHADSIGDRCDGCYAGVCRY